MADKKISSPNSYSWGAITLKTVDTLKLVVQEMQNINMVSTIC
jgi:hypothetical protein